MWKSMGGLDSSRRISLTTRFRLFHFFFLNLFGCCLLCFAKILDVLAVRKCLSESAQCLPPFCKEDGTDGWFLPCIFELSFFLSLDILAGRTGLEGHGLTRVSWIPKPFRQWALQVTIHLHQDKIASNYRSAVGQWTGYRAWCVWPVTLQELAVPELLP